MNERPGLLTQASITLALLTGCHGADSPKTIFRDSANVAIVDNRGDDVPLRWAFDRIATVGGASSAVAMNQLTEYTVDADTLGHVFVLDAWYGHRVQLIDTAGNLVRVLTRQGGGPGEVGNATSISASSDGTLAIMDFSKTGLVRVRWDGAVLPILRLTGYELFGGARATGDTVVLHTIDTRTTATPEQIRYRTATDTATLATLSTDRLGWIPFCRAGMEGLTPMLAPELRWTARGSHVELSRSAEYRIEGFQAGRLARIVRRTVPAVAGTVEAVQRFFPDGKVIGSRDCIVSAAELAAKRGVASTLQPVRRLAIDLEGRIWAERNTFPDETPRTDVFDESGRYLGTVAGLGAPLGFPSRDLIVFGLPDSTTNAPRLAIVRNPGH